MSTEKNVQTVKNFFAAMCSYNEQALLALVAADIEWIIPGTDWPLTGTHRGHAELAAVPRKASEEIEMRNGIPKAPRIFGVGRAGFWSSALCGEDQSHKWVVLGPMGFQPHRSQWQSDEYPVVHRHAGNGARRADGRARVGVAADVCVHQLRPTLVEPWIPALPRALVEHSIPDGDPDVPPIQAI